MYTAVVGIVVIVVVDVSVTVFLDVVIASVRLFDGVTVVTILLLFTRSKIKT